MIKRERGGPPRKTQNQRKDAQRQPKGLELLSGTSKNSEESKNEDKKKSNSENDVFSVFQSASTNDRNWGFVIEKELHEEDSWRKNSEQKDTTKVVLIDSASKQQEEDSQHIHKLGKEEEDDEEDLDGILVNNRLKRNQHRGIIDSKHKRDSSLASILQSIKILSPPSSSLYKDSAPSNKGPTEEQTAISTVDIHRPITNTPASLAVTTPGKGREVDWWQLKLDQDKEKRREQASREKEIMRELEEWKAQLYLLLEDSHTFFDNLEVKDRKAGKLSAELRNIKERMVKEPTVRKAEFNREMDKERTALEDSASSMRSNLRRRLKELKKSDSRPASAVQSPALSKVEPVNGTPQLKTPQTQKAQPQPQKTPQQPQKTLQQPQKTLQQPQKIRANKKDEEEEEEENKTTMMNILDMQEEEEAPSDEVKENGGRRKSSLLEQVRSQWRNAEGETEDPTEGEMTEDYFSFSEDEEDPFSSSPKLSHIRRRGSLPVGDRKSGSFQQNHH